MERQNQKFKHHNQKKTGHFRKQKNPQKRKSTLTTNSNHNLFRRNENFKNFQSKARDLANNIKKRRLLNLPNIISHTSSIKVTEEEKEKMKNAMVNRYNFQTKALDLTNFGKNDDLIDFKCELFRQPYLCAAIDIIVNYIPDLEALNLNENNLNLIGRLGSFTNKLPNLKILYLAKNNIAMHSSLNILKNLPLVELSLEGNPFIKDFKNKNEYVAEIRKTFPKLLKLDGKFLDPVINFDLVEERKALPSWKKLYLCNPSGQEIVTKFIQQYFSIYDSDNRQHLLDAYHDNALFSITATYIQSPAQREILTSYQRIGRNLLRKSLTSEIRLSSLKRGKVSVVALLNDLPPTKHDPQSFAVDLTFFTQQMIVLTITGIFKEKKSDPKAEYVRVFQKTLIIVPNSVGGLCIRNEMMHINNATLTQSKKAFKTLIIPKPLSATISSQAELQDEENTKIKMVQALSKQTNMNLEWSKKCLEETNYDYNRACFVFNELYKINKIPQEAFSMLE
ncbi:hypothetical protein PVAND_001195 [Polypedilum vanderplanki]|uniref:Nuclear RNA export factor 1-like protein n=1 Tax=Polypedilum vanderplanki TaxID=319348 RepID=A0A9J6BMS2_POLVA|nr:hypothetical protein PVAND_001195 [Polypedilum vanderplanki]